MVNCFLPPRARGLLTPFEVPQVPRQAGASSERDLRYTCFLPTAFEGGGMERVLEGIAALDKMSPPTGKERTSNSKK